MAAPTTLVAVPRAARPASRHPGAVVAGEVSRTAARSGLMWGLVFGVYVVVQTLAYVSAYNTQASRDKLAAAFGGNIGINALIGPAREINTVAGYSSWRCLGGLSLLGGIWGLLAATRLLRGEEEAGRYELLLAGQTTRRRAGVQALLGLGAGLLAMFVPTAVCTIATGSAHSVRFGVGESLYFALTLVAGAAVFLAVGALTSQLVNTRRRAAALAGVVFGVSYALRMVADSDPNLHWLVWLSPLGWIEESRPLTDPHPVALLPVLALIVGAVGLTARLAGTRDLTAATLPDRDSAQPRTALLRTPLTLAVRLIRPITLGWLFAVAALSTLIGMVAQSAAKALSGSNAIAKAIERLGGHGTLVAAYLGLTFLVIALLIALIAAGQIAAVRSEEAEGRLELLVVRPVSRTAWFAGRVALAAGMLVVAGLVAGSGAWAGAASQRTGIGFGSLLEAGLNVVPAAMFLLGLGALAMGVAPRHTSAVVYGYLAWAFLLEFLGAVVHASHWLLDTSVFFHMAPAPATAANWAGNAVLAGIGVACALGGGIALHRRDIVGQ